MRPVCLQVEVHELTLDSYPHARMCRLATVDNAPDPVFGAVTPNSGDARSDPGPPPGSLPLTRWFPQGCRVRG